MSPDHLCHAAGTVAAPDLDPDIGGQLLAAADLVDLGDCGVRPDLCADGHGGGKSDTVVAVEHALAAGEGEQSFAQVRNNAQRQVGVSDGAAEWALCSAVGVVVGPVPIVDRSPERVDIGLGDLKPSRRADGSADHVEQIIGVLDPARPSLRVSSTSGATRGSPDP